MCGHACSCGKQAATSADTATRADTATSAQTASNAELFNGFTLPDVRPVVSAVNTGINVELNDLFQTVIQTQVTVPPGGGDVLGTASLNIVTNNAMANTAVCALVVGGLQSGQATRSSFPALAEYEVQVPVTGGADHLPAGPATVGVRCNEAAGDLRFEAGDLIAEVIPDA